MTILECSSKGDKRFSAFFAETSVFNRKNTIENFYQLSKRFGYERPSTWKDAKGRRITHFHIEGFDYPKEMIGQWYKVLWVKYLDTNPQLVEYAKQFDDYSDKFKGKSKNCQADVIRQYIKEGRKSIMDECQPFLRLLNHNMKLKK